MHLTVNVLIMASKAKMAVCEAGLFPDFVSVNKCQIRQRLGKSHFVSCGLGLSLFAASGSLHFRGLLEKQSITATSMITPTKKTNDDGKYRIHLINFPVLTIEYISYLIIVKP